MSSRQSGTTKPAPVTWPTRRSALSVAGCDDRLVLRVLVDHVGDERTEWNDLEAAAPRVVERRQGEPRPEAPPLTRLVDLRMREDDAPVPEPVRREADQLTLEPELVSVRLGRVDDLGLRHCSFAGFEIVGPPEELHELARCVGLARVLVIGEAPAMGRSEAPGVARAQVR